MSSSHGSITHEIDRARASEGNKPGFLQKVKRRSQPLYSRLENISASAPWAMRFNLRPSYWLWALDLPILSTNPGLEVLKKYDLEREAVGWILGERLGQAKDLCHTVNSHSVASSGTLIRTVR